MTVARRHLPTGVALVVGLCVGWGLADSRGNRLLAHAGDRWGESVVVAGPIDLKFNPKTQTQIAQDAIYYLDYARGRLLASIPMWRATGSGAQVLGEFAERDLVADFDLQPGTSPHFLMTTANLGAMSEGLAPLFVFETTTGQVASYRVSGAASATKPVFQLIERRSDRRLGAR